MVLTKHEVQQQSVDPGLNEGRPTQCNTGDSQAMVSVRHDIPVICGRLHAYMYVTHCGCFFGIIGCFLDHTCLIIG